MSEEGFIGEESFGERDEAVLSSVTDAALARPVEWLAGLTTFHLKLWLRRAIWTGRTLPFTVPATALLVPYLDEEVRRDAEQRSGADRLRSTQLVTNLRAVVPALLAEWGARDPGECLDDLLVLCAKLRCAGATASIMTIATERLREHPNEVRLRQRCLSVLAGLDVTEQSAPVFRRFLAHYDYTALCYRALYRHDLSSAVENLPALLNVYGERREFGRLRRVLHLLLFDHLKGEPERVQGLWRPLLFRTSVGTLGDLLNRLQEVHITFLPPLESFAPGAERNYLEVTYLSPHELLEGVTTVMDIVGTEGMKLPRQKVILDCGESYSKQYAKTYARAA